MTQILFLVLLFLKVYTIITVIDFGIFLFIDDKSLPERFGFEERLKGALFIVACWSMFL